MSVKSRSKETGVQESVMPACWQREAQSACIRVELPSGEMHLFPYQHFVTASLKREDQGLESLQIEFSTHQVEIEGHGLRELLADLQDFAVKRLFAMPERYQALSPTEVGVVSEIRISALG